MKAFPTQQSDRTAIQEQDLAELLGMRSRLLAKVTTVKLADCDSRLVLFARRPVGVIKRKAGTMVWWSPARHWPPYFSINDAALSLVGDLVEVHQEGGMPAVVAKLRLARAEAIRLGARLEAMDAQDVEA